MRNDIKEETWLTAAQCAKCIGLTVRALRLYEQTGLIHPRRTVKNWRLYGANEIARLNEILTLKRLGFRLHHISRLLAGQAADLDRMLSMQNLALQEQLRRTQISLAIVEALRAKVAGGGLLSIEELLKLAKDTNMTDTSSDTIAWRRYEQARPRTEQKIDLALYADYNGYYLLDTLAYVITLRDGRLFSRLTGQAELEIFPEDVDRFFYKAVQAQLTFTRNESGAVSGLVLHQNGYEQTAPRVEESVVIALEEAIAKRIKDKRPVENSKALLQEIIAQHQRGEPDYEQMMPPLATAAREQSAMIQADLERMGPLKDMSFKGVTDCGWDVYDVSFERGHLEWSFALAADGRFSGIFIRPSL
ncbi:MULTISPECIES: MerR family transcriptional regulator [unclassified Rhizobium]|uniref:MerR family transcriptional regulator n=1 Tax=unclassified Rhizobium TaxID=2613769 RepID=UPI000EAA4D44|nr:MULTISPECIES: MerR family transcriptional regulator [unclassified Rhizobium]AYG69661.1 MerR family transcriptional regulator [Rhizobium sp. CCGE531]AYG76039.1 MerR family transcriptional regulator [Rhizobium sp. CCGE532]